MQTKFFDQYNINELIQQIEEYMSDTFNGSKLDKDEIKLMAAKLIEVRIIDEIGYQIDSVYLTCIREMINE